MYKLTIVHLDQPATELVFQEPVDFCPVGWIPAPFPTNNPTIIPDPDWYVIQDVLGLQERGMDLPGCFVNLTGKFSIAEIKRAWSKCNK